MSERWFLDDEPDPRFRLYCRGNVGEVVPDAPTPLSATTVTGAFQRAFGELFSSSGAFTEAEMRGGAAAGGVFGGYLYFNLSFARVFAARVPGVRVRDVDEQMLGRSDAPAYRPQPGDRTVSTVGRAAIGSVRMVLGRKATDLDAARAEVQQWLASLVEEPSDAEVVALAAGYEDRFVVHLNALLDASLASGLPMALLERLTRRASARDPGLLVRALSGLGTIETARPAAALWALGRLAAADPEVTAAFDAGVDGVLERLGSGSAFVTAFDAFLREHGHRGPNEVELSSDTWATAPRAALAAIDRLRLSPAASDPVDAGVRLAAERATATSALLSSVLPPLRPVLRRLMASAARGAARREQAKGTLVLGLSGLRRALFLAADRLVEAGRLPDRLLLFMATREELADVLRDPEGWLGELETRRRRYDELNRLVPPFWFEGTIPDPDTWPPRRGRAGDAGSARPAVGDVLAGIGVASGRAVGRVRVVLDPADPGGLEPGEVLVAPITDPAWTPLFLAAVAVVVDVGALQSHAAIVARELGIPAVVSVDGASRRLVDGDEVEVDGDRGSVRLVGRVDKPA
jgi:pyruvate,water dikinase